MRKIIILGIKLDGDAYPNASNTIKILESLDGHIIDNRVNAGNIKLWAAGRAGRLSTLKTALKILYSCLLSSALTIINIVKSSKNVTIYATYPSILTLLTIRPARLLFDFQVVCDSYISVWDSMFVDRAQTPNSRKSKVLKAIERSALKGADIIITDSTQNSKYLSQEFQIQADRFLALPLAIKEAPYDIQTPSIRIENNLKTEVLFIGTFIPLHGTDVISRAIELVNNSNIHFTIIGSGQTSHKLNKNLPNTRWISTWLPIEDIHKHISASTICLGIFGGTAKSKRVTPLKNYMYLRMGKCIISQDCYSTPDDCPDLPIEHVPPNSPEKLAKKIIELSSAPERRRHLESSAKQYYQTYLSNKALTKSWINILSL